MKIKGRTIIELTDVRTGKIQRFEDDNAFMDTNIEQKFRNFGIFQTSVLNNFQSTPLWQKLCGGLLLLDSVVADGANFVAPGQKMTGRGYYGSSNNGSPVNLGSWNATESAVSSNAVQMVYDFTTSQGNGDIKAVCLTSDYCGRIGIGNQDDDYNVSLRVSPNDWQGYNTNYAPTGIGNGFAFDGDFVYCNPVLSGTSLTIDKRIANAKKVDLIHTLEGAYVFDTISVTLPSTMTHTNNLTLRQVSATKLMLIGYTTETTDAFSVAVVDISGTPSATVTEITGMDKAGESELDWSYDNADCIGIDGNGNPLIAVPTYAHKPIAFVVNAGTGTKQAFKFDENYSTWTGQSYRYGNSICGIGNGFFMLTMNSDNVAVPGFVCDMSANSGSGSIHPCEGMVAMNKLLNGLNLWNNEKSNNNDIRLCQNPFYLATINNLATPVTKTSSQTMKVTYVISRANS